MKPNYIYKRKDGGTISCYGPVKEDSNFVIVCENENRDGVWTDNEHLKTWKSICQYLENNWDSKIEQIESH